MRHLFVAAAATMLLAMPVFAQSVEDRLNALLSVTDPPYLNGGVLVAEGDRIVVQRAFGEADVATHRPNTIDSRFQTASLSKVFTSTAVLQLVERKKLALDAPVTRYLPRFPFPAVTIRHLLSHTSGLPDLDLYEALVAKAPDRVIHNADVLPALAAWPKGLAFTPGSDFRYSNTNYVLLALLVETVSHTPFDRYLERQVFAPAGMRDTYVQTPGRAADPRLIKNHILPAMFDTTPVDVSTVQTKDPVQMRHIRYETGNLGATVGDQNVISTLGDLFRFAQAVERGRLLRHETWSEAMTAARLNDGRAPEEQSAAYGESCGYGLGWDVCRGADGARVGHSGYNRGISTMLVMDLSTRRTVIAFDNEDGANFDAKVASLLQVSAGRAPLEIDRRRSLTREYGRLLLDKGPAAALVRYNEMRGDSAHYNGTQRGLNVLGYDLLHTGHTAESLEPFRINVILHPDDANVYDSFAEALAANGRTSDAITVYEKAIALDPKNDRTKRALERLRAP